MEIIQHLFHITFHYLLPSYYSYRAKHEMDRDEFMFFLTGGIGLENKLKNPAPQWLSDKSWDEICRMCDLKGYKGTQTHVHVHVVYCTLYSVHVHVRVLVVY